MLHLWQVKTLNWTPTDVEIVSSPNASLCPLQIYPPRCPKPVGHSHHIQTHRTAVHPSSHCSHPTPGLPSGYRELQGKLSWNQHKKKLPPFQQLKSLWLFSTFMEFQKRGQQPPLTEETYILWHDKHCSRQWQNSEPCPPRPGRCPGLPLSRLKCWTVSLPQGRLLLTGGVSLWSLWIPSYVFMFLIQKPSAGI